MYRTKLYLCDVEIGELKRNNFISIKNSNKTIFYDIVNSYFNFITNIITEETTSGRCVNDKFLNQESVSKSVIEKFKCFKYDVSAIVNAGYDLNSSVYLSNSNSEKRIKYTMSLSFFIERFLAYLANEIYIKSIFIQTNIQLIEFLLEINTSFRVYEAYIFSNNSPISIPCLLLYMIRKVLSEMNNLNIKLDSSYQIDKKTVNLTLHRNICFKYILYNKLLHLFIYCDDIDRAFAVIEKNDYLYKIIKLNDIISLFNKNELEKFYISGIIDKIAKIKNDAK